MESDYVLPKLYMFNNFKSCPVEKAKFLWKDKLEMLFL